MNPLFFEYLQSQIAMAHLYRDRMVLFTSEYAEIMTLHDEMAGYADIRAWVLRTLINYLDKDDYMAFERPNNPLSSTDIASQIKADEKWIGQTVS